MLWERRRRAGPCNVTSPVLYSLNTLVSDAMGRAIEGTGIPDIIPRSGMSLHIHAADFMMLARGDIGAPAGATTR